MGKRGNGEGSISRRKSGGWMGQYTVYTAEGRKRRTVYGKTREEVRQKLTKATADRDGGLVYNGEGTKLGDYLTSWLKGSEGTIRRSTFVRYEQISRVHLRPALGNLKLKNVTPAHVRDLYRQKLDAGLSPRTVQYIHVTLHKALKQAVRDGMIPRNATEAVKPPRPSRKEMRPLSPTEVGRFLEAARGDEHEAIFVLAVSSGMRQGELLALRWEDVDLEAGTLRVQRSVSHTKDGPVFTPPKSAKSRRRIKLTRSTVEALKRHRADQNSHRLRLGTLWEDRGLVFPNRTGGAMRPWSLTGGPYLRLLKKAEISQKVRFHDLRHTCATLLLLKGAHPRLVQELLGHASISITMDTYSHVLPGMDDGLADMMEEALG
jgi:integrase